MHKLTVVIFALCVVSCKYLDTLERVTFVPDDDPKLDYGFDGPSSALISD